MCASYRSSRSRSSRSYYQEYPEYIPVSEKRARNAKAIAKLSKSIPKLAPVVIAGRTIATSWWGISWNRNLERYADYSNRIGRGRSYLQHGAVLDLQIDAGTVKALVQGSRSEPYEVIVKINPLKDATWDMLRTESLKSLNSLPELLGGKFPKELQNIFFAEGAGLFPSPKEINFECSCPDWAVMCKHVAAVLYGIGNRLDQAPELLFLLRQVTVEDLIRQTVETTSRELLGKAATAAGDDILADADLADVFGIEIAETDEPMPPLPPVPTTEKSGTKSVTKSGTKAAPARAASAGISAKSSVVKRKKPASGGAATGRRRDSSKPSSPPCPGNMVAKLLAAAPVRSAFATTDLANKLPGWSRQQVANTIQRAISEGRLERVKRGSFRRSATA